MVAAYSFHIMLSPGGSNHLSKQEGAWREPATGPMSQSVSPMMHDAARILLLKVNKSSPRFEFWHASLDVLLLYRQ